MKAMRDAIKDAHLTPEEIDYINVHGTSTPLGDIAELKAVAGVFGEHAYKLNISSTKSMTGHLLGGGRSSRSAGLHLCHHPRHGAPDHQLPEPRPEIDGKLNLTLSAAQKREVKCALSSTFGFGGHNATGHLPQILKLSSRSCWISSYASAEELPAGTRHITESSMRCSDSFRTTSNSTKLALIHKSASLILEDGRPINNERLEFLGDAVIESVTSDYVFIEFPEQDEGFMTQLRSRIVSRQSLNALAVKLGLDKQVIAGAGQDWPRNISSAMRSEAMMGAVYLDQGYEFVNRLLINNIFFRYLNIDELTESTPDYKSRLIEWCQKGRHRIEFHSESG